jgi:hypothetical protein
VVPLEQIGAPDTRANPASETWTESEQKTPQLLPRDQPFLKRDAPVAHVSKKITANNQASYRGVIHAEDESVDGQSFGRGPYFGAAFQRVVTKQAFRVAGDRHVSIAPRVQALQNRPHI